MAFPKQADGVIDGDDWDTVINGLETRLGAGAVRTKDSVTLGVGATTFAVNGAYTTFIELTGDAGTNTVATITGAVTGQIITLLFVDGLITITDTDAHGADTADLSAAFTSADDAVLQLIYDGVSWYEVSRSLN